LRKDSVLPNFSILRGSVSFEQFLNLVRAEEHRGLIINLSLLG
jgi:hypothetical protein